MAALSISSTILLAAFLIIAIFKTILFFKNIRHKKFKYWFYFDKAHIINSSSDLSERAKRRQNTFTIILMIIFFVELIVLAMMYKAS